ASRSVSESRARISMGCSRSLSSAATGRVGSSSASRRPGSTRRRVESEVMELQPRCIEIGAQAGCLQYRCALYEGHRGTGLRPLFLGPGGKELGADVDGARI